MKVTLSVSEEDLKKLVIQHLRSQVVGDFDPEKVQFLVMTKNNYRVKEWEKGAFKATYEADLP